MPLTTEQLHYIEKNRKTKTAAGIRKELNRRSTCGDEITTSQVQDHIDSLKKERVKTISKNEPTSSGEFFDHKREARRHYKF